MNTKAGLLIFPPGWSFTSPYLSIPLLVGYMRNKGLEVSGEDWNIRIINEILSDKNLDDSISKICDLLSKPRSRDHYLEMRTALILYDLVKNTIDVTKSELRTDNIPPQRMVEINRMFDLAFRIHSAAYFPSRIVNGAVTYLRKFNDSCYVEFDDNVSPKSLTDFIDLAVNENINPYYYFIRKYIKALNLSVIKYIGISVCGYSQLISALTIAKIVKESDKNFPIIIGGAIMPYLKNAIKYNHLIFQYVDFIVFGEGEVPLTMLANKLINNHIPGKIPGIAYLDSTGLTMTENTANIDLNSLSTPVFNVHELNLYLIPPSSLALPIMFSKNCYWGKCEFCGVNSNYGKWRAMRVNKFTDIIYELIKNYHINNFRVVDNCLPPKFIDLISKNIIEKNIHISWQCMARIDLNFSKKIWEQAYESGLKVVSFGLETYNQNLLNDMNKGISNRYFSSVLSECHFSGIFIHCFFMIGFPGEENVNSNELLEFIGAHRYIINSVTISLFRLERLSPIYQKIKKYNIELKDDYSNDYILPNCDYMEFCNSKERIDALRLQLADFECSEIAYSGIDDMYIMGEIFSGKLVSVMKWASHKVDTFRLFLRMLHNNEMLKLSSVYFVDKIENYYIYKKNKPFSYYIMKNNEFVRQLNTHTLALIKPIRSTCIKYIYDNLL